jgi:hypothetical protein
MACSSKYTPPAEGKQAIIASFVLFFVNGTIVPESKEKELTH